MSDRLRRMLLSPARPANLRGMVFLSGQRTIFPLYHVVSDKRLPHIDHLYSCRNQSEFERDLEEMLGIFEPLSMENYFEESALHGRRRGMVLSFDDGLTECHQVIAPLLKRKGIPALFFLNNRFIDNNGIFYRYKASILIDRIMSDRNSLVSAAGYLDVPENRVVGTLQLISGHQQQLIDSLSAQLDLDFDEYLQSWPVYMNSEQVKELIKWGFDIGGHGFDHAEFAYMEMDEMVRQVRQSIEDLKERFGVKTAWFSFPFTSEGVPESVIRELLDKQIAEALFGTAGLKKTGLKRFIQRIPMEIIPRPAMDVLKAEYLYYLLKMPLGKNRLRY